MVRPSLFPASFQPASRLVRTASRTTKNATDFLHTHDKIASLLPTVSHMIALQNDCRAILSAMFDTCNVVHFDSGQLVLSIPNAALATKLKQQLPKLQDELHKRGWQIIAIRLKVQARNISANTTKIKELALPVQAISSLSALVGTLENSPRNAALKAALNTMVERHRTQKP